MQLFISHASEDKDDFVRPLADALQPEFTVWYDEYQLTLGMPLLESISAGLSSSDFGIVVLSPAFFRKKWPKAELEGLFALETVTSRRILPIWKDVSADDVCAFSPIIASRVAVSASSGLNNIVREIRRATSQTQGEVDSAKTDAHKLRYLSNDVLYEAWLRQDYLIVSLIGCGPVIVASILIQAIQKGGDAGTLVNLQIPVLSFIVTPALTKLYFREIVLPEARKNKMRFRCPTCKRSISASASSCPNCGERNAGHKARAHFEGRLLPLSLSYIAYKKQHRGAIVLKWTVYAFATAVGLLMLSMITGRHLIVTIVVASAATVSAVALALQSSRIAARRTDDKT